MKNQQYASPCLIKCNEKTESVLCTITKSSTMTGHRLCLKFTVFEIPKFSVIPGFLRRMVIFHWRRNFKAKASDHFLSVGLFSPRHIEMQKVWISKRVTCHDSKMMAWFSYIILRFIKSSDKKNCIFRDRKEIPRSK